MKPQFKLLLLFVIAFVTPFFASAQSNYLPGYIVTLNGDTLKGLVDYREWDKNPTGFKFKDGLNAKPTSFSITNASAFGINGHEYFEKQFVSISLGKIQMSEISTGIDTTTRADTVFLKVIVKGKNINLYSFTDEIKTRFYYSETGKKGVTEFAHYVYNDVNHPEQMTEINSLLQLNYLAEKYNPAALNHTTDIQYNENDMVKIIGLINGGNETRYKGASNKGFFFVGFGAAYNTLKFEGSIDLANANQTKNSVLPYVTAGIVLYPNSQTRKFYLKAQFNFIAAQMKLAII